jgi:hypothetical protein
MKTETDERIASLLKAGAPPQRDPAFRLAVLERRERWRFRKQVLSIAFAALLLIAIVLGSYRAGARVAEAASVALLCVALASALVYLPVVVDILLRRVGTGHPSQDR